MTPDQLRDYIDPKFPIASSLEEALEEVKSRFGTTKHQAKATIIVGMAINTTFELIAQMLEEEKDDDH